MHWKSYMGENSEKILENLIFSQILRKNLKILKNQMIIVQIERKNIFWEKMYQLLRQWRFLQNFLTIFPNMCQKITLWSVLNIKVTGHGSLVFLYCKIFTHAPRQVLINVPLWWAFYYLCYNKDRYYQCVCF